MWGFQSTNSRQSEQMPVIPVPVKKSVDNMADISQLVKDHIVKSAEGKELWCIHELPRTQTVTECTTSDYCPLKYRKMFQYYCKRYEP